MKKILLAFLIFLSNQVYAVAFDSLPIKILRLDSITAKGKPEGTASSMEINKSGGNIVSDDGRLELIFPEGALSKKRKISIQPVTNHMANGRGNAYHLTPSGIQFEKPVRIVFHYTEEELSGSLAELKGIAWQDDQGKWQALESVETDTIAKTITSTIQHFSSYAQFDKIVLIPTQARVKVEKTLAMAIHLVGSAFEESENEDEDFLPGLPPSIPRPEWYVNNISRGSVDVGRIQTHDYTNNNVNFIAPVSVPDQNPVAVSAQLKGMKFKFNKKVFTDPELVSHVLIYDRAYRINIQFWVDNSEDGMCTMRMEDEGGFTVVMEGRRTQIKEISNHNLKLRLNPCKCAYTWVNQPLPGPIHIIGASRVDVIPARVPDIPFSRVSIFLKHTRSPMPDLKSSCPTGGLPPAMGMARAIMPPLIEFEANNEDEKLITLSELSNGSIKNDRRQGLVVT
ncbi:MAG TPA: hypothetical protein VGC29_02535, partial [Flavisolibacter sp.]